MLKGIERKETEQWLATEFTEQQPPTNPTGLQAEFICESKEAANNHLTDAFFCYTDSDEDEAIRFHYALMMKGITTWTKKN